MNSADKYDVVILGIGTGGKWMARTMAREGMRPLSSREESSVARV